MKEIDYKNMSLWVFMKEKPWKRLGSLIAPLIIAVVFFIGALNDPSLPAAWVVAIPVFAVLWFGSFILGNVLLLKRMRKLQK